MDPPVNRIERGQRIGRYPFQVTAVVRQALAGTHLPLLIVPDLHEIRAVGFQFGMYQQHCRTHLARHAPAFDQTRAGERNDDADDDHRELQRIVAPCPVESGLPDRRPVRRTGTPGAAVIPATAVCRAEVLAFTGSSAPGRGLPCAAVLAARTLPHLGLPARPALRFGLRLVLRAIMLLVTLCALLRSVLLSALRPSPSSVTTPGRFFRPVFRHLLVETPEAAAIAEDLVQIPGIDEMFIGLNDLSLGYGKNFMFELLLDGTVEELCLKFRKGGIPYGFGGIASLGKGMLPSEYVIKEHYRLGSACAILSRSFCRTGQVTDLKEIQKIFEIELPKIRELEEECRVHSEYFWKNRQQVETKIRQICECEDAK